MNGDAGIAAWGVGIPVWRLDRAMHGKAWDTPSLPGERAAAAGDQDSLALGVEAALEATRAFGIDKLDFVAFASTTTPYAEKHAAATIAGVLDRADAMTVDVTGTLRAGTTALRAALDAVRAGSARAALVVASDVRPAEPGTSSEQLFGDGAAAVVITPDAPVRVIGEASVVEETAAQWRRADDDYVRSFDAKFETEYGYVRSVERAVKAALEDSKTSADAVTRFAAYAPDPRTHTGIAKRLGFPDSKDPLFTSIGNLGAAHAFVSLSGALDDAKKGHTIVVASVGEGADAIVLEVVGGLPKPDSPLAAAIARKRVLPSYERYLRARRLLPADESEPPSSTIRTWRDRAQMLRLEGVRCTNCGMVQFPANRACIACSTLDKMEHLALQKTGTVFTFTLDHLVAGEYLETPVPRAVVDLDGGGRIFVEVTDCEPSDVAVGMPVELTFRLMHEGAGFKNYYWKARPRR